MTKGLKTMWTATKRGASPFVKREELREAVRDELTKLLGLEQPALRLPEPDERKRLVEALRSMPPMMGYSYEINTTRMLAEELAKRGDPVAKAATALKGMAKAGKTKRAPGHSRGEPRAHRGRCGKYCFEDPRKKRHG